MGSNIITPPKSTSNPTRKHGAIESVSPRRKQGTFPRYAALFTLALAQAGCQGSRFSQWLPTGHVPAGPEETMVLRGGELESDTSPEESEAARQLAGAHELYRRGEFSKAGNLYHKIADNKKNSPRLAEEARYYEAESLRREGRYPRAADTYNKLLMDFPGGAHRDQAVQHMFDIANYWLDDTRAEMVAEREKKEGKRWFYFDSLVHFEKSKPLLDQEGRAIEKLEQCSYSGVNSEIADHSLFLLGSIKFYREDYREADHYFSQLVDRHPNSPYAAKAVELAIIAKHMSTGGSDYDGRKVAEARELVHKALYSYPELAEKKKDFLDRQLAGITHQQAEKDFKKADFYRRTRHPGSAYFYYGIVARRYPGSPFAEKAEKRMAELMKNHSEEIAAQAATRPAPVEEAPTPGTLPELGPVPGTLPEQGPAPRTLPGLPSSEQLPRSEAQQAPPKKKSLLDRATSWIRH